MSLLRRVTIVAVIALTGMLIAGYLMIRGGGLRADREPFRVESFIARHLVRLSIPSAEGSATNPLAADPAAWRQGAETFQGQCAACHGADGRGRSTIGPKMYPPVPDLASPEMQAFSDGELFAIVSHGVSWTGMPAFRSVLKDDEIWRLVSYLRRIPNVTAADIEPQAPSARADIVMEGTTFTPGDLTVSVGQTVSWLNNDPFPHNVESPQGGFQSGDLESSNRWQFRVTRRGDFEYVCTLHPGMKGVLHVR